MALSPKLCRRYGSLVIVESLATPDLAYGKESNQKQHPVSPKPKRLTPRYAGYGLQVGEMRGANNLTTRNIVHGRRGKRAFLAVAHDGLQEKPKGN